VFRVKNEGLFLEAAVESILRSVDEVVIVDNQSTDLTLEVARALEARHSGKIKVFTYEHSIARCGEDNENEFLKNPKSPHLLANFYNFAFGKATMNYLLKWDGDMIATPAFHDLIKTFRHSKYQTVSMKGFDVSKNSRKIDSIGSRSFEPRLFRRLFSNYHTEKVCEALSSPFLYSLSVYPDDCFIHLKFIKEDPFSNHTAALTEQRKAQMNEMEKISQADIELLAAHGIVILPDQE
jgi:glycosyltransferase involved in cell wall biosynthesis